MVVFPAVPSLMRLRDYGALWPETLMGKKQQKVLLEDEISKKMWPYICVYMSICAYYEKSMPK